MIYYQTENGTLHQGDVLDVLRTLPSEFLHMVVTSPPYWGLRDYDIEGQIGLEKTPEEYISKLVDVFREVRRVLRKDGTLWLNIGDSYASTRKNRSLAQAIAKSTLRNPSRNQVSILKQQNKKVSNFKIKDMIGIPWRVAFALQADGWYLRQDIIWHKPNSMPESVTDRCTKAHEYIFLLSKSKQYFFDNEAIKEKSLSGDIRKPYAPGQVDCRGNGHDRGGGKKRTNSKWLNEEKQSSGYRMIANVKKVREKSGSHDQLFGEKRNRRSVWTITTQSFPEAHFATFPEALPRTCILAGCPIDGVVLDPFGGAGTTGLVAEKLDRKWILIELSEAYCKISKKRIEPWTKQLKMKLA